MVPCTTGERNHISCSQCCDTTDYVSGLFYTALTNRVIEDLDEITNYKVVLRLCEYNVLMTEITF